MQKSKYYYQVKFPPKVIKEAHEFFISKLDTKKDKMKKREHKTLKAQLKSNSNIQGISHKILCKENLKKLLYLINLTKTVKY